MRDYDEWGDKNPRVKVKRGAAKPAPKTETFDPRVEGMREYRIESRARLARWAGVDILVVHNHSGKSFPTRQAELDFLRSLKK